MRDRQEVLLRFLESKNKSSTISEIRDLRILRQCTPLLKRDVITKVTSIKMKADCDAADVISVAQSIPSIVKVKAYSSMMIYSSSLTLLEAKVAMKASVGSLRNVLLILNDIVKIDQYLNYEQWAEYI